jgi:hypothetical protein
VQPAAAPNWFPSKSLPSDRKGQSLEPVSRVITESSDFRETSSGGSFARNATNRKHFGQTGRQVRGGEAEAALDDEAMDIC